MVHVTISGLAQKPHRSKIELHPGNNTSNTTGVTLFKPALTSTALGVKVVSVRPDNANLPTPLPTVPASILLTDVPTGLPLGLIESTHLTGVRTAAASAVAAKILSSYPRTMSWFPKLEAKSDQDSLVISILGAGVQAEQHVIALLSPASLGFDASTCFEINIFNRTISRAEKLCQKLASTYPRSSFKAFSLPTDEAVEAVAAISKSHIICLTTGSQTPVLFGKWISDKHDVLVVAIGSYTPTAREMDDTLIQRVRSVVLDAEEAYEAGDIAIPVAEKTLLESTIHFQSLGELIHASKSKSKTTHVDKMGENTNVTLFKGVGSAVLDVATAAFVLKKWNEVK